MIIWKVEVYKIKQIIEPLKIINYPAADYLSYKDEIDAAINRVLNSGWYILGKETAAFEQEFSNYIGARYGIGVGSGTEALHLSLSACGIGPGDEVLTVSHTAVATVAAIELCGAKPKFIDIDDQSFTLAPELIEGAISDHAKAILPVHLYGHPANLKEIIKIAREHDLYVVEDCAQSHGADFEGKRTGAWGDVSAFSFYPTKNLGAIGDGGMVLTNDPELREKIVMLREYGWKQRYISEIAGLNSRLDELQAAILRVKLPYLDKENTRRRKLASLYNDMLKESGVVTPQEKGKVKHVYHQYVIKTQKRDELKIYLKNYGVEALIHYPVPIHLQPAYKRLSTPNNYLTVTEDVCNKILSLPVHPQLSEQKIVQISELIIQFIRESQ